jgi:hypothetical protein
MYASHHRLYKKGLKTSFTENVICQRRQKEISDNNDIVSRESYRIFNFLIMVPSILISCVIISSDKLSKPPFFVIYKNILSPLSVLAASFLSLNMLNCAQPSVVFRLFQYKRLVRPAGWTGHYQKITFLISFENPPESITDE